MSGLLVIASALVGYLFYARIETLFYVCRYAVDGRKRVYGDRLVTARGCETIRERSDDWKPSVYDECNDADHIIDNIYLGNVCAAHDESWLNEARISVVFNMATEWVSSREDETTVKYTGIEYLPFAMEDRTSLDEEATKEYLNKVARHLILKARETESNVLVHCNMGISRSTSVVLRYLQLKHNMSYEEAFKHIKERRPVVRPNYLFARILRNDDENINQRLKRNFREAQSKRKEASV